MGLLRTQRRHNPHNEAAPPPPPGAVRLLWKSKTKAKPLNKHNGLAFDLPWGTEQDQRTWFSPPPPPPNSSPALLLLGGPRFLPRHGVDQHFRAYIIPLIHQLVLQPQGQVCDLWNTEGAKITLVCRQWNLRVVLSGILGDLKEVVVPSSLGISLLRGLEGPLSYFLIALGRALLEQ